MLCRLLSFLPIFVLLQTTADGAYTERCPLLTRVADVCRRRIRHRCQSNSECTTGRRCCPHNFDGGCTLRCVKPRLIDGCPVPIDFAVLVDSSGSISRKNFVRLRQFIQDMVDTFDIAEDGTHFGLIEYSTQASLQIKFNDFSGAHNNVANVKRKIRKIPHARGYTYIDKALYLANTKLFTEEGGARPNVPKIVLVLTDGRQTVPDDLDTLRTDVLANASRPLKERNVTIIAVGIGKGVHLFDLWTLATSDRDVYLSDDFEDLRNLVTQLTARECPVNGQWAPWGDWSTCTTTCGGGMLKRSRTCTKPKPAHGGQPCTGESEEIILCNEDPCPVDGKWTDWEDWSQCSVTCGGGTQNRTRTCSNPPPAHGGKECTGESYSVQACNEDPCPVDGDWTEWDEWDTCTVTCGGGTQGRSRTCTNPVPQHGGKDCDGNATEGRSCNEQPCPIDGNWTDWEEWGKCSLTCGGGIQKRTRTCTNPPPAYGGEECPGEDEMIRSCNEDFCAVDGNWADWENWDSCSVTCGGGTQSRSRTCTNPAPRYGGKDCRGIAEESLLCNEQPCPVDGNWTDWGDWNRCPVTCGGGAQSRSRTCTNPPPAYGGRECSGEDTEVRECGEIPCPVDGNWTEWDEWDTCTVTCGGGTQGRSRTCTNPVPQHGGKNCDGIAVEGRSCNEQPCPIDGNWAVWRDWSPCSVTCGDGSRDRYRTCTNPPPKHGGAQCPGNDTEIEVCNERLCPGDGNWASWSFWTSCTVTCSTGTQQRSRTCTNPPPLHGGRDCAGESGESRSCDEGPCPVDGKFTNWSEWEECPLTCGGGTQRRSRTCTNPAPAHGGADCFGERDQARFCNVDPCPVDGKWTQWKPWSTCTVTCGGGTQVASRTCTNPSPAHGGRECTGKSNRLRSCNDDPCPVDGGWTDWTDWTSCSVTCGGGMQDRSRTCTNPLPAHGGQECVGSSVQSRSCGQAPCSVNGNWSPWSSWELCPVTCGSGEQRRYRTCTNPAPAFGGADCLGQSSQVYICDGGPCPVDGNWARWATWTGCSATCGFGTRKRDRTCTNPRPSLLGRPCPGDKEETSRCIEQSCAVDGNWGSWTAWSECSITCGGYGRLTRERKCNNPPPSEGGKECVGRSRRVQYCRRPNPCSVTCAIPLDFAILVDTSGSISGRNFKLLLNFIQNIVRGFKISETGTHIAVIEYSTEASVQLKFNDLKGRRLTPNNVIRKVRGIPHKRGYTYIDRALRLADEQVFVESAGMRKHVTKVALVMTDGEQTVPKGSNETAQQTLRRAVKPLQDKGVRIISLGIGKRANNETLEAISSEGDVFFASNFRELRKIVSGLKRGTCSVNSAGFIQRIAQTSGSTIP